MFGIGTTEFLVILLVAVLVLGPEHLPRILRTISKVMSDFRKVSTDFQRTMNLEAHKEEWERQFEAANTPKKKKKKKKISAGTETARVEADISGAATDAVDAGTPRADSKVTRTAEPFMPDELTAEADEAAAAETSNKGKEPHGEITPVCAKLAEPAGAETAHAKARPAPLNHAVADTPDNSSLPADRGTALDEAVIPNASVEQNKGAPA